MTSILNENRYRDSAERLSFDADDLRKNLTEFFNMDFNDPLTGQSIKIGNLMWSVYVFYDYDDQPIYVGQANEKVTVHTPCITGAGRGAKGRPARRSAMAARR
jgi:hypothetical protein